MFAYTTEVYLIPRSLRFYGNVKGQASGCCGGYLHHHRYTDSYQLQGATGLPAGIVIVDPNTGVIKGTPSTVGTFNVTVTAGNLAGDSAGQVLELQVNPSAPVLKNTAATNVGSNSAVANVELEKTGGKNPSVTVYYGRTDGGTNTDSENGGWTDKVEFGEQEAGTYQIGISGLDKGAGYKYRTFAT